MGSLATRRVMRRSAPAKIAIVEGKPRGGDASEKENMVNGSLYSLFETHYERANNSPCKGHPQAPASAGDAKGKMNNVLQPRKIALIERTVPVAADENSNSRELSPPELTTSDTFKPAKRTLAPNCKPAVEEDHKQLPKIRIPEPEPAPSESCDVLVSSPTELKKLYTPELQHSKVAPSSGRRDVARKTPPTHGRRLSIVRVSIAREGGALLNSKKDGGSSAKKPSSISEQSNRVKTEADRARLRYLERRKSIGLKTTPIGKHGIGSFGGRPDILKKDGSEKVSPDSAQKAKWASKTIGESRRTSKLSMVLKSEQRLVEKNEQYGVQLKQLQIEIEEKDYEMERLRSAALMLNNLINRQGDEIRELRVRLRETFNENADVRDVCETLERELRKTREALTLERMQKAPAKSYETKLGALTTQFQSMAVCTIEPRMIESCIEEGEEDSESQADSEVSQDQGDFDEQAVAGRDVVSSSENSTIKEGLPLMQNDEDTQYTLQDLQEMVMQEEDLLKERCANALKELNLPLTPLLTPKGSLDVAALKTMLASISSKAEYLTTERMSAIRRLSAWLGST